MLEFNKLMTLEEIIEAYKNNENVGAHCLLLEGVLDDGR